MKHRPMTFKILAAFLSLVAIAMPIQAAIVFGHGPLELEAIFNKLTLLNWLVMTSCLAAAASLLQADKVSFFFVPLAIVTVALNNLVVGLHAMHFDLLTTSMTSLGFAISFIPIALNPFRQALLDPRKRWWRTAQRVGKQLDAKLQPVSGNHVVAQTMNISESGAFVAVPDPRALSRIFPGQSLKLNLSVNCIRSICCDAIVVRRAEADGRMPAGYGLQFVSLNRPQKRRIKQLIAEA